MIETLDEIRERGCKIRVGDSFVEFALAPNEDKIIISFRSEKGYDMTIPKELAEEKGIPEERVVEAFEDKGMVTIQAEPLVGDFELSFIEFSTLYLSLWGVKEGKKTIKLGKDRKLEVSVNEAVKWKVTDFSELMRTIFAFNEFNLREVTGILRKFKMRLPFVTAHVSSQDLYIRVYPSREAVEFMHSLGEVSISGVNYHKLFSHLQWYVMNGKVRSWRLKGFGILPPKEEGKHPAVFIEDRVFTGTTKSILTGERELNEVLLKTYLLML